LLLLKPYIFRLLKWIKKARPIEPSNIKNKFFNAYTSLIFIACSLWLYAFYNKYYLKFNILSSDHLQYKQNKTPYNFIKCS